MKDTNSSENATYNKNTYIGYLKVKKGGMKIIPGDIDTTINNKRTKIINHLKKVLSGGKSLKEKNIKKYFKALGGKYIRGGMVGSNEDKNSSIRNADKLLKLSAKNKLPLYKILSIFKGSAPTLYNVLDTKVREPNPVRHNNMMYGGKPLEQLRADIGRSNIDNELNILRKEIYNIRNNLI